LIKETKSHGKLNTIRLWSFVDVNILIMVW